MFRRKGFFRTVLFRPIHPIFHFLPGFEKRQYNHYGDDTFTFASLMDNRRKGSHVISPAWRPDGIRCVDIK
jgi:hypothetical protein